MCREYLRQLRYQFGMTQEEVARETGISSSYYSMVEMGRRSRDIKLSLITRLAKVFGIDRDIFIAMEEAYLAGLDTAERHAS